MAEPRWRVRESTRLASSSKSIGASWSIRSTAGDGRKVWTRVDVSRAAIGQLENAVVANETRLALRTQGRSPVEVEYPRDHLIFRWRLGRTEYALSTHAWEPFSACYATLRQWSLLSEANDRRRLSPVVTAPQGVSGSLATRCGEAPDPDDPVTLRTADEDKPKTSLRRRHDFFRLSLLNGSPAMRAAQRLRHAPSVGKGRMRPWPL
jgi:hypothetical protein